MYYECLVYRCVKLRTMGGFRGLLNLNAVM
jgi:hypothetical protein